MLDCVYADAQGSDQFQKFDLLTFNYYSEITGLLVTFQ